MRGIVLSWVVAAAFILGGERAIRRAGWLDGISPERALAVALVVAAVALAAGIGGAAGLRQFGPDIDGGAPPSGSPLDITLRYVTNTTEQLVLFACAAIAFAHASPDAARTFLPVMGGWFLIARGLFWIGYLRDPVARATGFAGTFHPTLALLLATAATLFAT